MASRCIKCSRKEMCLLKEIRSLSIEYRHATRSFQGQGSNPRKGHAKTL